MGFLEFIVFLVTMILFGILSSKQSKEKAKNYEHLDDENEDAFSHSIEELMISYQISKKEAEKVLQQRRHPVPPPIKKAHKAINETKFTSSINKEEFNPYSFEIYKEKEKTFLNRLELRNAIIYKEILDKPKAFKI